MGTISRGAYYLCNDVFSLHISQLFSLYRENTRLITNNVQIQKLN